jgi:hypothetical protein
MNANDLADRLEQFYIGTHIDKAAETLRQQQAEIEALKKELALQKLSDIGQAIEQRELTDEEIKLEAKYFCHTWFSERPEKLILFARAILRKASEK